MELKSVKLKHLVKPVSEKNKSGLYKEVLGVAIEKEFMPSVANLIGTDLTKYNVVRKGRFAFNPMHVGRDEKLPIALYKKDEPALVSPAYMMFEIFSSDILPDFLLMLFKAPQFDHICWFHTDASVRGGLSWEDFLDIDINLPSINEQRALLNQLNSLEQSISLLKSKNNEIEKTMSIQFDMLQKRFELEKMPLTNFCTFQEGPGIRNWQFTETGVPFINIRCMNGNEIYLDGANFISAEEAFGKYKHFLLNAGDIVISTSGTLGKSAIVRNDHLPLCLNTSIIRFNPINAFDYSYLYCLLKSEEFIKDLYDNATGSAQLNLGPTQLKATFINVPNANERREFEKIISPLIEYQQLMLLKVKFLNKAKSAFLSNLF